MKLFGIFVTVLAFTGTAFAGGLPGKHTDKCRSELSQLGNGTLAVYDGNWSGLEQTAIVNTNMYGSQLSDAVLLAAVPAKPAWGVQAGCTVYRGTFDGKTFSASSGQRSGETVTYQVAPKRLKGELVSPDVKNQATMRRVGTLKLGG